MDIGVWMRADVLAAKLEAQGRENPEQAWNMGRWPEGLSEKGEHRLFVASGDYWCGYFKISGDALFDSEDERTPFRLLFDTRTWTPIAPIPVKRFKGFTYRVPSDAPPPAHRPMLEAEVKKLEAEVKKLEKEKEAAVAAQDFERAAFFRGKADKLKKTILTSGSVSARPRADRQR